jgi:hypothetical protein
MKWLLIITAARIVVPVDEPLLQGSFTRRVDTIGCFTLYRTNELKEH